VCRSGDNMQPEFYRTFNLELPLATTILPSTWICKQSLLSSCHIKLGVQCLARRALLCLDPLHRCLSVLRHGPSRNLY
jgi:hypothetical protein